MRREIRRSAVAGLAAGAVLVAGCGAEDFPNDPRPPAPVELSARIDDGGVVVAPSEIGAGLATITISNQAGDDVALNFERPRRRPRDEHDPGRRRRLDQARA